MDSSKKVLVLFSGGRDSSAAAIEMIRAGYSIKLFSYQLKELIGPHGDSAPDIRHLELMNAFPQCVDVKRTIVRNLYLVKKLAIDKTNITHVVYPIAVALAIHSSAILFCLKNDIHDIVCGYSGYQAKLDRYIEQRNDFFKLMESFLKEYDINYHAPVIDKSKDEIIDILDQCGISSNSLESKSIFIGGPFEIDKVLKYWDESIPICREYIAKMRSLRTST
ncbi:MAG: 7-cyano-7-deazaguanine synthase [Candidatus Nomurabacteria bacterium]|nr:7-cyano-7-deazaguanine synthase [Candidatus Nomurabacteria bacterium]